MKEWDLVTNDAGEEGRVVQMDGEQALVLLHYQTDLSEAEWHSVQDLQKVRK